MRVEKGESAQAERAGSCRAFGTVAGPVVEELVHGSWVRFIPTQCSTSFMLQVMERARCSENSRAAGTGKVARPRRRQPCGARKRNLTTVLDWLFKLQASPAGPAIFHAYAFELPAQYSIPWPTGHEWTSVNGRLVITCTTISCGLRANHLSVYSE